VKRLDAVPRRFKDSDAVTAPPFETHTFALDGLWEARTSYRATVLAGE